MRGTITIGARTYPCVVDHSVRTTEIREAGGTIGGDPEEMEVYATARIYPREDIRYVLGQFATGQEPRVKT